VLTNTILYLCDDLTKEMRKKELAGRTITLKIRLSDFSTFTRSRSLNHATNRTSQIRQIAEQLYTAFGRQNRAVRLLGVGVSNLADKNEQLDLFPEENQASDRVDRVMDQVRKRFGDRAITRASLLEHQQESHWIRE